MKYNRKYKYVIFGSGWDLYKISYADVSLLSDAVYISDEIIRNNYLRRLHLGKINRIITLPFKDLWNKFLFINPFQDNDNLCFIFFTSWIAFDKETGFISYLKQKYPNSKFVWFLQDLYYTHPYPVDDFDLVLSYDKNDCEKYGFIYHHTVFSQNNRVESNKQYESDVLFVGKAKDRLFQIYSSYEKLSQAGLHCRFFLLDVPKEERLYPDKIHYLDKIMPYSWVLENVASTKCILEIMQARAQGYTYRLWESITFDKKLLTNNDSLEKDNLFYSKDYISIIKDEINNDNINFILNEESYINPHKNQLSPVIMLDFVDKILNKPC